MSNFRKELEIVNSKIEAARAAVDGKRFNYFRYVRKVLRSIDMANNASVCRVNYAPDGSPQAEVFFEGSTFAAEGIERNTRRTVSPFFSDVWLIVV